MSTGCASFPIGSNVSCMTYTETRQAVAAEVRAAQGRKGWTQAELAAASGVSTASLSRKMRGQRSFTVEEMVAIATALDIDAGALLTLAVPQRSQVA